MNYIINPMWFYWFDVFSELNDVAFTMFWFMLAIILICVSFSSFILDELNHNDLTLDTKKLFKIIKSYFIVMFCFLLIFIVIPNKDTMYKMIIAKNLTMDNVELGVEDIKDTVDYIVYKIIEIKGE